MSAEVIPDPTDDRKAAIVSDELGVRLAPAALVAPAGTGCPTGAEPGDDWIVVGYYIGPPTPDREDDR